MNFKSAAVGALALLLPALAHAAPVTWTLKDAVFSDGGVATGSFVWDADTETFGDYQFLVSGGDVDTFAPTEYSSAGAGEYPHFEKIAAFLFVFSKPDSTQRPDSERNLYLSVVSLLTNAGGEVDLDITHPVFAPGECFECNPYRPFVSGSLVADTGTVPEPGAWALMLLGFGSVGIVLRQRQAAIA